MDECLHKPAAKLFSTCRFGGFLVYKRMGHERMQPFRSHPALGCPSTISIHPHLPLAKKVRQFIQNHIGRATIKCHHRLPLSN